LHYVTAVLAVGLLGAYLVAAVLGLRAVLGLGAGWRSIVQTAIGMGPGRLLRHTYRALILLVAGLVVLSIGVSSYARHLDYQASPACTQQPSADCRDFRLLQVSKVELQYSKSGDNTVLDFAGGYGSATFYSEDVSPTSVRAGDVVNAEVWHADVTAIVIDGTKHQSFASQSDAWIGIVAGAAILLLGLMWLAIDLAFQSIDPDTETSNDTFVTPFKRRRALYVLLPLLGALLACLGLGYVAILAGSVPTASVLAAIYFIGGFIAVPLVVVVFVAWFVRAYLNMGALGLRIRHSAWFVGAALLVPPLSLYMPSRLMGEVVAKTQAGVGTSAVTAWWLSGLGFVALTAIGAGTSSPDPYDTSARALTSDVSLAASVIAGIVAAVLSLRLIRAVDASELALARDKGLSA
jgi:uncharacterized protein DUF4328